jgi:membrane associated rhomboid family serine protease
MQIRFSISNILIMLSAIATLLVHYMPVIYIFGINNTFLNEWLYHIYFIQFFTGTFLHWNFWHFLANALFIFIFWNIVEWIIWKNKFIIFFIFVTIFDWITLSLFSNWNTVWISWFCMALISYYTLELKSRNDMDYKWWITALVLNILIWLVPWISLFGHLFWAIAWVIYYLINKDFFRKKWVWIFNIEKS